MAKFKLTYQLVEKAVELKREGLNDCDIAAVIGVCKQTFSTWNNHPKTKVQMDTYRRELGLRALPARKSHMRRLSYEWLAGLREIVIDPERCPLTFAEFTLKEYMRDRDGNWIDEIPDGNDH